MRQPVHFIPIATTVIALVFFWVLVRRYRERRSGPHLLWWAAGVLMYGLGTFTESFVTLLGWNEVIYRSWYISGALLGGAPLAQGTVYLLLPRRTANRLTVALISFVAVAAVFVLLTPLDYGLVEAHRLTGRVMEWGWVRLFSPFINLYAVIFLVGGAALSAWRYRKRRETHHRFVGNVLIAVGAILPGIGGAATRAGYTEVLYIGEFVGIILIWLGYWWNVRAPRMALGGTPVSPLGPEPLDPGGIGGGVRQLQGKRWLVDVKEVGCHGLQNRIGLRKLPERFECQTPPRGRAGPDAAQLHVAPLGGKALRGLELHRFAVLQSEPPDPAFLFHHHPLLVHGGNFLDPVG